jgi:hypothetical protein
MILRCLKKYKALLLAALLAGAVVHLRDHVEMPYTWLFCWPGLAAIFACLAAQFQPKAWRYLNLTLMAVMLALFVTELRLAWPYLAAADKNAHKMADDDFPSENIPLDESVFLGQPEIRRHKDTVSAANGRAYEITYSSYPDKWLFTPYGWRVTPQYPQAETAVVFIGCSFTIGLGVTDVDTFPYKTALQLGPAYQVYNLGIHGAGPHNMLDMIERGLLDDIVRKHKNTLVFFITIEDHLLRASGYILREHIANPRYVLVDGKLIRQGAYDDASWKNIILYRLFKRSQIYRTFAARLEGGQIRPMAELYAAIIKQADSELKRRYGFGLTVILWAGETIYQARDMLVQDNITFLDLSRFFPDYPQNPEKYRLYNDTHPNARANEIASRALAELIRRQAESGAD